MRNDRKGLLRGLQDIRTLSGRVDQATLPYKDYMKISCLEMEKFRRGKERESAMVRVRNIDARMREIEAEKNALMQELNLQSTVNTDCTSEPVEQKSVKNRNSGGFKIRY
jgi:hypothetical protein